jgi:hypothetical protein
MAPLGVVGDAMQHGGIGDDALAWHDRYPTASGRGRGGRARRATAGLRNQWRQQVPPMYDARPHLEATLPAGRSHWSSGGGSGARTWRQSVGGAGDHGQDVPLGPPTHWSFDPVNSQGWPHGGHGGERTPARLEIRSLSVG